MDHADDVADGSLTFVIPVRDAEGVSDWLGAMDLLRVTIASCLAQDTGGHPRVAIGASRDDPLPEIPSGVVVGFVDPPLGSTAGRAAGAHGGHPEGQGTAGGRGAAGRAAAGARHGRLLGRPGLAPPSRLGVRASSSARVVRRVRLRVQRRPARPAYPGRRAQAVRVDDHPAVGSGPGPGAGRRC